VGPVVASDEVQWDGSDVSMRANDLVLQGNCLRIWRRSRRGMVTGSLRWVLRLHRENKERLSLWPLLSFETSVVQKCTRA